MIRTAVICLTVAAATSAEAGMIHNTFGLSSPAQTINFGEFSFANYTPITTEFSSLGVEFSPNLWTYDYNAVVAPNIDNNVLFNFNGARQ